MKLLREQKLEHLLPDALGREDPEASGVCAKDGSLYIIFDNFPHIEEHDQGFH